MAYETIAVEDRGAVRWIKMNRPQVYNALNPQMMEDLLNVTIEATLDSDVRVVVITGSGKAFSSGGDVKAFGDGLAQGDRTLFYKLPTRLHQWVIALKKLGKPVIAAVNGPAVGAGLSIMLACDLVLMKKSAYFNYSYLKIGLSPDGGSTFFLPRLIGPNKAMELLLFRDNVTADEGKQMGLVAKVFPDETFDAEVEKVAVQLAEGPTVAIAVAKRLLSESFDNSIETQLENETQGIVKVVQTADFSEGVTAFVEKRNPQFSGK